MMSLARHGGQAMGITSSYGMLQAVDGTPAPQGPQPTQPLPMPHPILQLQQQPGTGPPVESSGMGDGRDSLGTPMTSAAWALWAQHGRHSVESDSHAPPNQPQPGDREVSMLLHCSYAMSSVEKHGILGAQIPSRQ